VWEVEKMDEMTIISNFVTLLVALSVATERFVEIFKGFSTFLSNQTDDINKERKRKLILHSIAIIGGIITTFIVRKAFGDDLPSPLKTNTGTFVCGLLASGGSGFWNSVMTWTLKIKDIKDIEFQNKKREFNRNKLQIINGDHTNQA